MPPDLTQEEHIDGLPHRHARRHGRPLHLPAGRRVRDPDPPDARPRRARRGPERAARGRAAAGSRARAAVHGEAAAGRGRPRDGRPTPEGAGRRSSAGPHAVGVAFLKKPSLLPGRRRASRTRRTSIPTGIRASSRRSTRSRSSARTARRARATRPAGAASSCRGRRGPTTRSARRNRSSSALMRRAYRRPVTDADLARPARALSQGARRGRLRRRDRDGARAPCSSARSSCSASSAIRPASRRTRRIASAIWSWRRGSRSSSGAAFRTTSCSTLAARGKLHEPAVLERQVRRMLADPRSQRARDQLRGAVAAPAQPRRRSRRTCGCSRTSTTTCARRSARRPSCSSTASCARTAACSICCAPTTRSSTSGWRSTTASRTSTAAASAAIALDEDSERGGLLRQGSILTVTSYATRTSPVVRGKWVLDNLLGVPPPPPLPDVPALKDNTVDGSLLGAQAAGRAPQQRRLRRLPQPDGSGRPVAREVRRRRPPAHRRRAASPIDASGGLPDGSQFADVHGLEAALLRRPELFVGTFTEKLLTYALGPRRRVLRRARRSARSCATRAPTDFRFSSIILGVVKSQPFQMRTSR